jgi:hypothetical protein
MSKKETVQMLSKCQYRKTGPKSVYFLQNVKKRKLLRKTNYNFIKIDLNFPATLASPSFELVTLGIESKTLNPTAMEAYTIKKL